MEHSHMIMSVVSYARYVQQAASADGHKTNRNEQILHVNWLELLTKETEAELSPWTQTYHVESAFVVESYAQKFVWSDHYN